jgi:hypothetical protein
VKGGEVPVAAVAAATTTQTQALPEPVKVVVPAITEPVKGAAESEV